jgi:hypothetical protein
MINVLSCPRLPFPPPHCTFVHGQRQHAQARTRPLSLAITSNHTVKDMSRVRAWAVGRSHAALRRLLGFHGLKCRAKPLAGGSDFRLRLASTPPQTDTPALLEPRPLSRNETFDWQNE